MNLIRIDYDYDSVNKPIVCVLPIRRETEIDFLEESDVTYGKCHHQFRGLDAARILSYVNNSKSELITTISPSSSCHGRNASEGDTKSICLKRKCTLLVKAKLY